MEKELQQIVQKVKEKIADPEVLKLFETAFLDTFNRTVSQQEDGSVYMVTGDIPAMWLRDSSCQLRPILPFLKESPKLAHLVKGIIRRQLAFMAIDPYANAYTMAAQPERWDEDLPPQGPHVWEQKYEIDSLCFPFQLIYQYWQTTADTSLFDASFVASVEQVVDLWIREQNHETNSAYTFVRPASDYLSREGKGSLTTYTGMTWSGFRPSDDPCQYHYLVPSNLFASHILARMLEMLAICPLKQVALAEKIKELKGAIDQGLDRYAKLAGPKGEYYAYEVDGLGNQLVMDDSNMPSLLSLPMLTAIPTDDPGYLATRQIVLSNENPYYYQGTEAAGIGSPHTPVGYVWPIAIAVEGITAQTPAEKWSKIQLLIQTTGGTGQVHESFDPNQPTHYTREWFSWANAMFCELVLDYCGYQVEVK